MPKILRIINRFNIGGPTYNVAYLTKYLPEEYETLLVGGMPEASEEGSGHILADLGIEPVLMGNMKREIGFIQDYKAYKQLRKIIREYKPDIVHTHASKAGALGRLAARKEGVPFVVHTFHGHVFHSYFGKLKTGIFKEIERFLAGYTDKIVAISEKQKYELADIHGICKSEKISVVPLGFDLTRFWTDTERKRTEFRTKYRVGDNDICVGIIGRLVPVKNHRLFLDAAKKVLSKTDKKVRFFIIGDGEERENILDYAKNLGLDVAYSPEGKIHDITLTSWIKDADWAMAGLDVVALTSLNEGTPVSLIEAQAASKPVVSTKVGGITDVVLEGKSALLSENDNVEEFANNILWLIDDHVKRRDMALWGREFVEKRFHYTRLAKDMTDLYASLLVGQKARF